MNHGNNANNAGPRGRGGPARGGRGRGRGRGGNANPRAQRAPAQLDYLHNVGNYAPVIRKGDAANAAKFEAYGLKALESKNQDSNVHPIAAGLRSVMTAQALGQFYRVGIRHTYSLWGSPRDDAVNLTLNKCKRDVLGNAPCDIGHYPRDPTMMALDIVQPLVVPKDITRINADVPTLADLPAGDLSRKGFLYVDLYHLTPDLVAGHLGRGTANWAVWIGHQFNGLAGVCEEGGWVRDERSKLIMYRPDSDTATYPLHPDMSWLWENNVHPFAATNLVWSEKMTLGSYHMVVFKLEPNVLSVPVPRPVAPAVREVKLTLTHVPLPDNEGKGASYWMAYAQAYCTNVVLDHLPFSWLVVPETKVLVQVDIFEKLRNSMACRSRTTMALKQLAAKAREMLEADRVWGQMYRLFPSEFQGLVYKTVVAAFYHNLEAETSFLKGVHQANTQVVQTYNEVLNNIEKPVGPLPPASGLSPWFMAVAAAIAVFFGVLHRRRLPKAAGLGDRVWAYLLSRGGNGLLELLLRVVKRSVDQCHSVGLRVLRAIATGSLPALVGKTTVEVESRDVAKLVLGTYGVVPLVFSTVVTPLFEEAFKRVFPWKHWWWVASCICGAADALQLPFFSWGVAVSMSMLHMLLTRLPYKAAVFCHGLYNVSALWTSIVSAVFVQVQARTAQAPLPPASGLVKALFDNAFIVPWEQKQLVPTTERWVAPYPAEWARQPRPVTAHCTPKPKDPNVVVKGSWPYAVDENPRTYVWWLLPTSVLGFAPSRTDQHLATVVLERIMLAPPMDPSVQAARWAVLDAWETSASVFPFNRTYMPIVRDEHAVKKWYDHFDDAKHKARYAEALTHLAKEGLGIVTRVVDRSQVMVKTDEVLLKYDYVDGAAALTLKPRAIAQVHPYVQAFVGPSVYIATERLKRDLAWDAAPDYVDISGRRVAVYLFFAPGSTDETLSAWLNRIIGLTSFSDWFIAVAAAGDDSVFCVHRGDVTEWGEGDFGMFDQSQSTGPLSTQDRWGDKIGIDQDVRRVLVRSHSGKFVIISRDKTHRQIISVRPMRRTGGGDTTQGNTVITLSANRYAIVQTLLRKEPITAVQNWMRWLGFDLKLRVHASWTTITFLKGMWVPVCEQFRFEAYWTPLPSRFLKVGKSLRDPRELYREPLPAAASHFLSDLANSYKEFLVVGPLARFCANFATSLPRVVQLEAYKVLAAPTNKPQLLILQGCSNIMRPMLWNGRRCVT